MSARLFAAAALAALAFGGAAQAQSPDLDRIKRCKAELAVHGPMKVEQRGRRLVAIAGGFISEVEAKAINDCARTLTRRSRSRDIYPLYASSPACYRNAPILYRGNQYCFRGR